MICVMSKTTRVFPRDLYDDFRMNFRSIPEAHDALASIMTRVGADRSIRFKDRLRPKRAQVANALFLYVASLPVEQQRAIVKDGIARLNELLTLPAEVEAVEDHQVDRPEPPVKPRVKRKGAG